MKMKMKFISDYPHIKKHLRLLKDHAKTQSLRPTQRKIVFLRSSHPTPGGLSALSVNISLKLPGDKAIHA